MGRATSVEEDGSMVVELVLNPGNGAVPFNPGNVVVPFNPGNVVVPLGPWNIGRGMGMMGMSCFFAVDCGSVGRRKGN